MGVAAAAHRALVAPLVNVLVTGASAGIGAALAVALSERGDRVGLIGRSPAKLDAVLARCSPACQGWAMDLGSVDAAAHVALEAWDRFGDLDVLVNNAAVPKRRAATALTPAEVEDTMRVNFFSPVAMTLAVLPRMLERDAGVIVNVSSVGGRIGIAHEAAYCASKFALSGWSESLAIDLHGTGVKIRLVHPGPIATDIWEREGEDPAVFVPPLEPPSLVASAIIDAIGGDKFEWYVPDLSGVVTMKHDDIDGFIAMNAGLLTPKES